ncbi:hypothetical protein ACLOJK_004380 [Asimina triloba]
MEVYDDRGENSVSTDCRRGGKGGRREDDDTTAGLGWGRGRQIKSRNVATRKELKEIGGKGQMSSFRRNRKCGGGGEKGQGRLHQAQLGKSALSSMEEKSVFTNAINELKP